MPTSEPLPVDDILMDIAQSVARCPITIVEAPPGSGKTTRVPAYLMRHGSSQSGRIVLLQPRRIAAISVANRIASEVGCKLGNQVGYAVRFDSRSSSKTQLLVATEGILRRQLSDDISLADIGMVVFDEFHERSLDSDLLLAMCRHLQRTIRPDLRIVIMSATIASADLKSRFKEANDLRTEGRSYPVTVQYKPLNPRDRLPDAMAKLTAEAVERTDGDVLVFLPGKGEIFQTHRALQTIRLSSEIEVLPLFGSMPLEQQSHVVNPSPRRRVILATNIAETSLTIPGIRTVIDSGLARVMRFDSGTGLDRLELERICQASADQRAGRAGRVAAGLAIRAWSEASQKSRPQFLEPELYRVDFSSALLQLYQWDEPSVEQLPWLDLPRAETLESAQLLLCRLGAINSQRLTSIGRSMAALPLHPRLARLVVQADLLDCVKAGAAAAALLSERDPFIDSNRAGKTGLGSSPVRRWQCDVCERLEAIDRFEETGNPNTVFGEIHRNSIEQLHKIRDQILNSFGSNTAAHDRIDWQADKTVTSMRKSFLTAFPDRLAKRRDIGKDRGLLVGGKGVRLTGDSGVVQSEFFICLDVDGAGVDAKVRKATAIERDWLAGENLRVVDELFYSPTHAAVQCRRRTYWLDLCLEEATAAIADKAAASEILSTAAKANWHRSFPSDHRELNNLLGRVRLLIEHQPELELPPLETLLHQACDQICLTATNLDTVKSANWIDYIRGLLNQGQITALNRDTPAKVKIAGNREMSIDYSQPQPVLAIKIQDAFGMKQSPKICNQRVSVLLHLLAPNMRPQQITDDLESFWKNGYPVIRKELKRRYSKHAWPEDPTQV